MCIQQDQDNFHTLHDLRKVNSKLKFDYMYVCVSICVFVCGTSHASSIYPTSGISSLRLYLYNGCTVL